MKILLLNDNPVVHKLVTLSAQKTSDEVEVATKIDDISATSYDLLVVDDSIFSQEFMQALDAKIKYENSLFICSKDTQIEYIFTSTLTKPFLPTDLVEIFSHYGRELHVENTLEDDFDSEDDAPDELEDISLEDSDEAHEDIDDGEELNLDDELSLEDSEELALDDELNLEDDEEIKSDELEDDLDIENELNNLGEEENLNEEENLGPILDKDELQEVQDLLEESEQELNIEDDLDLDELGLDLDDDEEVQESGNNLDEIANELETNSEVNDDDELDLEDLELDSVEEKEEELSLDDFDDDEELNLDDISGELETDDDLELDNVDEKEEELSFEDEEELSLDGFDEANDILEEENLEDLIESAEEELTEEDLNSEIDIDEFANLTTNGLKVAVGELSEDDLKPELIEEISDNEIAEAQTEVLEKADIPMNTQIEANSDGVESLKKLLKALSSEDVAASMKGAKININIELSDSNVSK